MLTPHFHLKQTKSILEIIIQVPYVKMMQFYVSAEDKKFIFVCKPYHLQLVLPGAIVENENFYSSFRRNPNEFTFTFDKLNPGEDFKDLDYATKFLCEEVVVNDGTRKIEVLSSTCNEDVGVDDYGFGFAQRGGYNLTEISGEFINVFDIDPFQVAREQRDKLRVAKENKDFRTNVYLPDLLNAESFRDIINLDFNIGSDAFDARELSFLKDLSNVEFDLSEKQKVYCMNSLVDILYAYCYDRRTTFYEGSCDSSYMINKISATLSSFASFDTPREAIVSAMRRSLIYAVYCNFDLSMKILEDLKALLRLKEVVIIKALIKIYNIFLSDCDSVRYILNNLFIKDYIVYLQKWDKEAWAKVANEVAKMSLVRDDLGLTLFKAEGLNKLSSMMDDLFIIDGLTDSDDDFEESSD